MPRRLSVIVFVLLIGIAHPIQDTPVQPAPIALKKLGEVTVEGTRAFSFFGNPVCDGDGNAYYNIGQEARADMGSIWKLNNKGEKKAVFKLPNDLSKFYYPDFTVSPRGDFVMLAKNRGETYAVYFDSDGGYKSKTRLQLPDYLEPRNFAVFFSGELFISGVYQEIAPSTIRGRSFIGIFHSNGSLVKRISPAAGSIIPEPSESDTNIRSGSAVASMDGNVYNLRSDRILVISPSGEVVKSIAVSKPEKEYAATKLHISNGVLSVQFTKENPKDRYAERYYRTFNSDGMLISDYTTSREIGNSLICFNSFEGYTFYKTKAGNIVFVRAWVQ